MNRYCLILIGLMFAVVFAAVAEAQLAGGDKPTVEVDRTGCVTAECHANVKDYKVIHGPINVNACDACHELVNAVDHKYAMTRVDTEICTFCHKLDLDPKKTIHEPLKTGNCMECHNPHGGFDGLFLRSKSMNDLCKNCHDDVTGEMKAVHGPVAAGACGACHTPHQSDNEKLLLRTGRDMCFSCHGQMKMQFESVQVQHEPVERDCTECHDAHASDWPMMVKTEPLKLCTEECHEDVKKSVYDARYKHSAVTKDAACTNCHTAHGGDLARLMKDKPINICLNCHDKDIDLEGEGVVANISDLTDESLIKHGPVGEGSCGGCHNVHGSDVANLLIKEYPKLFYASFDVQRYDLCFTCHEKQLALLKETRGLTGFRDGDQNLHYLHVNKSKRGRTCRACHSVHASNNDVHIRDWVPYGSWRLPIDYSSTENGGTCAPGCHKPYTYDRTKDGPRKLTPSPEVNPGSTPEGDGQNGGRPETLKTNDSNQEISLDETKE